MASKRKQEKLNKRRQKLVNDRDKLLAKAAKKGKYTKFEKKLLAAKKIGIFIPVEGRYDARLSKRAGVIYTFAMAILLSVGLFAAYMGMVDSMGMNVSAFNIFMPIVITMIGLSFVRTYLAKRFIWPIYGLVVLICGICIRFNIKKLVKCVVTFFDVFFMRMQEYEGREVIATTSTGRDITLLFVILGMLSALLIVATAKTLGGTTLFALLTLPCVGVCMIVGKMPDFIWFIVYELILVGVTCADGIVGYKEYGKQSELLKKETKIYKKQSRITVAEQATTGAYVKIMLISMVAALAVALVTALVFPKGDFEDKKADDMRKDLEDGMVKLETKLNNSFNLNLNITDKITGINEIDVGEGSGKLPDLPFFLDVDKLKERVKDGGGMAFGVIPEGPISLDGDKEKLTVTVGKLTDNLYIKGYIADTYEKGRWAWNGRSYAEPQYVSKYLEGLESRSFVVSRNTVLVDSTKEGSGTEFIPYFLTKDAYGYEYNKDGSIKSFYKGHTFFLKYDVGLDDITDRDFRIEGSHWEDLCNRDGQYVSDDDLYEFNHQYIADNFADTYRRELVNSWIEMGYVWDIKNDILISNSMYGIEEEYLTDYPDMLYKKVEINDQIINNVKFVQSYLSSNMTYTLSPPKNDTDLDSASFFLKESRAGYCMHFATSGALLLAEMGVPVRYVEGYVLTAQNYANARETDFAGTSIETDGDFGEEGEFNTQMYEVPVYGANAHAWIEVYLMGIGWVPVEMTKVSASGEGFESVIDEALQENNPTKEPEKTKEPVETKEPSSSPKPEETKKPTSSPNPEKTKEPKATIKPETSQEDNNDDSKLNLSPLALGIIIGTICFVTLITGYAVFRKTKNYRINQMLVTRRGSLKYMFTTLEKINSKKGIVYENDIRYDDYARLLSETYEFLSEEDALSYMESMHKELFSKEGITEEEFENVKRIYGEFISSIFEEKNKFYVFYLKHFAMVRRNV